MLELRLPPHPTLTHTLFPYTPLFRSRFQLQRHGAKPCRDNRPRDGRVGRWRRLRRRWRRIRLMADPNGGAYAHRLEARRIVSSAAEIGRAHVCTPVPNAHLVCRLLLEKKKHDITKSIKICINEY